MCGNAYCGACVKVRGQPVVALGFPQDDQIEIKAPGLATSAFAPLNHLVLCMLCVCLNKFWLGFMPTVSKCGKKNEQYARNDG